MASLTEIKNWFKKGKYPTEQQYAATWDSFHHKDDLIPIARVAELIAILNAKAEKEQLTGHLTDENAHAALFQKVYTPYRFTTFKPAESVTEITLEELVDAELDCVLYQNQTITEGLQFDPVTGTISGWEFGANIKIVILYTKL